MPKTHAKFLGTVIAFLAFSSGSAEPAQSTGKKLSDTSLLSIEEAIAAAKRCVLEHNVHLAGSTIESAQIQRNSLIDGQPSWLITWATREAKGGQVFVSISQSRECKITYGE